MAPPTQVVEFHDEAASRDFRSQPFDQFATCSGCPTGCQQVIDE
jgi:aldehyde:ferredoxin oxidoreductase